jgi:hypothetical protein
MIQHQDIFPVRIFTIEFPEPELILAEVLEKKKEIQQISDAFVNEDVSNYITDFERPVKIESFEKGVSYINEKLGEQNQHISIFEYWTAFYTKNAFHGAHIHATNSLERQNYAGVLYLTNHGFTTAFAPSESCYSKEWVLPSGFGNATMFPKTLIHAYRPGETWSDAERIVMSFNARIGEKDD